MALEEFLAEFNEQIVDAIDAVWGYAYDAKEESDGVKDGAGFPDEDDPVVCALIDVEIALETMRDLVSHMRDVPVGGRHASEVLVGKLAGTITIVCNSAPDLVEYRAAREKAAELLGDDDEAAPVESPPPAATG